MQPVADPTLAFLLLVWLRTRAACEHASAPVNGTMPPDPLGALCALELPDLLRLAESTPALVQVGIDAEALARALRALAERRALDQLRDEFIRQGAPPALMSVLFSLRVKATLQRRRELHVRRARGRPRAASEALRAKIERRWQEIAEPDPRRRYLALRASFPAVTFDMLYQVVAEYEAGFEGTRDPRGMRQVLPYRGRRQGARGPVAETNPCTGRGT